MICSRFLFEFIARDEDIIFGALGEAFSEYRLMAEQMIIGLGAGDHCLSLKEVELFEAVFHGLEERVHNLILQKVSMNNCVNEDGRTPLYIASQKGHGAVVKLLLQGHTDATCFCTPMLTIYAVNYVIELKCTHWYAMLRGI